jgi:Fur family iron response transcriptional regulator
MTKRPYAQALKLVQDPGLRPTRQRLLLSKLLFERGEDWHVTAESLHEDVMKSGARVSLATVYNTLHQFTACGLLRQIVVDSGKAYFDTNISNHHHFYDAENGLLADIPNEEISLAALPSAPEGSRIGRIDVVIQIENI